ncbi:MAG: multidrug effflux MFS transporter [Tepidamorphaceae bacterium]
MTATLGLLTALGPLSTDMYLPSLPYIAELFDASVAKTQLTLSVFLVGFALSQIVFGPVSDRLGRRSVLVVALGLFALASLVCAFAGRIETLIGARFLQALGAAGGVVIARTIVRDLYTASRAGQELALMGTIMGVVPLLAPGLGAVLHELFGWRANFVVAALMGLAGALWIRASLPETLKPEYVRPSTAGSILRDFGALIAHPVYRVYLVFACCAYSGLFSFISVSSYILQDIYGLTELQFGLAFACAVAGFMLGTLAGRRLTGKLGIDAAIGTGTLVLAGGGLLCLLLTETAAPGSGLWRVLLPAAVYFLGVGIVLPQSMAGAMTPFPDRAGAASSLLGFMQMSFAAIVGIVVAANLGGTARSLAVALAVMGCTALAAHLLTRGLRRL